MDHLDHTHTPQRCNRECRRGVGARRTGALCMATGRHELSNNIRRGPANDGLRPGREASLASHLHHPPPWGTGFRGRFTCWMGVVTESIARHHAHPHAAFVAPSQLHHVPIGCDRGRVASSSAMAPSRVEEKLRSISALYLGRHSPRGASLPSTLPRLRNQLTLLCLHPHPPLPRLRRLRWPMPNASQEDRPLPNLRLRPQRNTKQHALPGMWKSAAPHLRFDIARMMSRSCSRFLMSWRLS